MRSRPAPVSRAKASSSFAKKGLSIPFDRYQTVSPLANRHPNPTTDRLQAEPMLVRGPDLDRFVGMFVGFFADRLARLF
jgi:hypothetical protein